MIETQDDLKTEVMRRWAGTLKEVEFKQDIEPIYSYQHPEMPIFVSGKRHCKITWVDNGGRTIESRGSDLTEIFWFDTMDLLLQKDSAEDRWLQDQGII